MRRSIQAIVILLLWGWIGFSAEADAAVRKTDRAKAGPNYQTVPPIKFQEIFKAYVCRTLKKEPSDVVVSKLKVLGNKPVPPGSISIQLSQKNRRRIKGNVRLIAVVSVNSIARHQVKLSAWVDIYASLVCADRALKRGQIITVGAVYLVRKNISYLSQKYATDIDQVVGYRIKNHIKAGGYIQRRMLKKPPVIEKGALVTILAESRYIKVTAPGKILSNADLGQFVKVRNLVSKKEIYAKVINNSTVRVDF